MEKYKESKYGRAKKKVENIKGFYNHLVVYLIVNTAIILIRVLVFNEGNIGFEIPHWSIITTPLFWGIGLFFHGLWVFSDKLGFIKNWEERKIREFMREEEEEEQHLNY
ncbi:2TM domain-containing protein [Gilvibacter sp.]|uniref:2TM domain-containing protein n=1 Tax=Gilvibacter sp. TaxID=2729997 RepID=UPI0025C64368|nr:2TM domain-containing protein [Gilvibacter sp.]NQX78267.1 2TM domain-containing protein [Gilvibacter sp.]